MAKFISTIGGAEYEVEADTQQEADAFAQQAHSQDLGVGSTLELDDIVVTPESNPDTEEVPTEQPVQTQETKPEPTFLQRLGDIFTGSLRKTPETEELNDWAAMPELNEVSLSSFKTGLGTLLTNPEETAGIIKAQYPDVQMRTDYNGNIILKSSIDGKEYAIKPGFQASDIPRTIAGITSFIPAGRVTGAGAQALAAGGTQAAMEGIESATGGDFSGTNVAATAAIPLASGGVNALKNVITKGAKGVPLPVLPQEQLIQEAKKADIPLMTSDVFQPETFVGKTAQATGERIPVVGTGTARASQQESRVNAVQSFFDDAGLNTQAKYDIATAEELIKKRGADLTKYTALKRDVFNGLRDKGVVATDNAVKAIDDGIAQLNAMGPIIPKQATQVLNDYKSSIQNQDIVTLEDVRKTLGDAFKSPELASASDKTQKITNQVYRELNKDIEGFIKQNGEARDVTKWKVANRRLSELANEARNTKLKNVLNDGDVTPEKVNQLLFSQAESDIKTLYRNLNPEGRQNAKMAVIKKAYDDVVKPGEMVSPEKFITTMRKLQKQTGVIFNQADKDKLDGLVRVLNTTRRAADAGLMTNTGQQLAVPVGALAVGTVADSFVTGLLGSASLGLMARAYESKPVRDALIKISKLKKYSKEEDEIIKKSLPTIQAEKPKE